MSLAITGRSASTFMGEGRTRCGVIALAALSFCAFLLYGRWDFLTDLMAVVQKRHDAVFSSAFTFLSIFWAAMLTVWSLLKSRATRYIERLTDTIAFRDFLAQLEGRLVASFIVIGLSFFVYILGSEFITVWGAAIFFSWFFLFSLSNILLFDSLVTARVVLD